MKDEFIYEVGVRNIHRLWESNGKYYKTERAAMRNFKKLQDAGIKDAYIYGIPKAEFTSITGRPLP